MAEMGPHELAQQGQQQQQQQQQQDVPSLPTRNHSLKRPMMEESEAGRAAGGDGVLNAISSDNAATSTAGEPKAKKVRRAEKKLKKQAKKLKKQERELQRQLALHQQLALQETQDSTAAGTVVVAPQPRRAALSGMSLLNRDVSMTDTSSFQSDGESSSVSRGVTPGLVPAAARVSFRMSNGGASEQPGSGIESAAVAPPVAASRVIGFKSRSLLDRSALSDDGTDGVGTGGEDDADEFVNSSLTGEEHDAIEHGRVRDYSKTLSLVTRDPRSLAVRPITVAPDGRLFLETFSPIYREAYDFIIAIAEPVARARLIHEYVLTPYSLWAAFSLGFHADEVISILEKVSKTGCPPDVAANICKLSESVGKVKQVLHHNRYFVESEDPAILKRLLANEHIAKARLSKSILPIMDAAATAAADEHDEFIVGVRSAEDHPDAAQLLLQRQQEQVKEDAAREKRERASREDSLAAKLTRLDVSDNELSDTEEGGAGEDDASVLGLSSHGGGAKTYSFEVNPVFIERVRKECISENYPMVEEYDFRNDKKNVTLDIDLRPEITVRPYQEKALSKMFGNGRARSGVIVLPCGAGKTLVGLTATCTIKKSAIILCTSAVAVEQWKRELKKFTNIRDDQIALFTADKKEFFGINYTAANGGSAMSTSDQIDKLKMALRNTAGIYISTYHMIAFAGPRSHEAKAIMDEMQQREWGLVVLDEVHVVPANTFRRVLTVVKAHAKLGLTATLVREDDKIADLNFLIGPKLYEANWLDLQRQGYIARVQCVEVWCPMTGSFYDEYLRCSSQNKRRLLYAMNPEKFRYCQYLVQYHEARGDKIIVFSDLTLPLRSYATLMKRSYIDGSVPTKERIAIFKQFQASRSGASNTVFISRVGDNSIDLPEASVIIQVASHFGARRQEAQRLGRILRPKVNPTPAGSGGHIAREVDSDGSEFNAYFYSLVSQDTSEMFYATKRQQYLIDQGYAYKVLTKLPVENDPTLRLGTEEERRLLLQALLTADDNEGQLEKIAEDSQVDNEYARHTGNAPRGRGRGRGRISLSAMHAERVVARMNGNAGALSGAGGALYSEASSRGRGQGIYERRAVRPANNLIAKYRRQFH